MLNDQVSNWEEIGMLKLFGGVVLAACIAVAADNPVKVTRTDNPEKALFFEVTIPAKLDDVWRAFATREGAQESLKALKALKARAPR